MLSKLFRNPKPALYMIVVFVAILVGLFSCQARAHETSELRIEGGSAVARGVTPVIGLDIKWPGAGPVGTDWEAGFLLSGSSTYNGENPNAVTVYGMLVDGYKNFEAGLGFAYTNVEYTYACQETFSLMARYRATERVAVQWRHFSSAGSCEPNTGRDYLTVSWRF